MREQPAWHRLSTVALDQKVMVMDRGNGRWVMVTPDALPDLDALRTSGDLTNPRVSSLAAGLAAAGLGGPAYASSGNLTTLILKITKVCNYGCKYCYDMEPDDKLTHLSLDVALSALDEALRLAPGSLTVILHGGEPTLFFDLIEQLVLAGRRTAASLNKKLVFAGMTNLSRLTPRMVEFSRANDVNWGISLDGPPEINDRFRVLRSGEGTYQRFQTAFAQHREFVRECGILTTVTTANESRLLEIARHFRDIGMHSWGWSLFQPIGMGRADEERFAFSIDRVIASWNQLFDAVVAGEFDGFAVLPVSDYVRNLVFGPGANMCMRTECGAARDLMSVSHDGSIEGCDCIDRKGPLSGLGLIQIETKDSLLRARATEKAERIRSRDVTKGANACAECIWLSVCGGTCLAHAGSLHGIWEAQCRIAMNAFERISASIASSDTLRQYMRGIATKPAEPTSTH